METTVINKYTSDYQAGDIYIGRKTNATFHFGNPFHIGRDGTREEVIEKYEKWLKGEKYFEVNQNQRKWILGRLHHLKGKRLVCYCKPRACHGDVLVKMIEEEEE